VVKKETHCLRGSLSEEEMADWNELLIWVTMATKAEFRAADGVAQVPAE